MKLNYYLNWLVQDLSWSFEASFKTSFKSVFYFFTDFIEMKFLIGLDKNLK